MKSIRIILLQLSIFSILWGCDKDVNSTIPPCDPDVIGQNTEFHFNQIGTLTLMDTLRIDTLRYFGFPAPTYFISAGDVSNFLLHPCNLPSNEFDLVIGDTINILFSGTLMLLPSNASSAISLEFELSYIKKY